MSAIFSSLQRPTPITSLSSSTPHLPPDPYTYLIPSTSLSITFYSYGLPLPSTAISRVISFARADVLSHNADTRMARGWRGWQELNFQRAELLFAPMGMTWGQFGEVLGALGAFVKGWDSVMMGFEVWEEGRGTIGEGEFLKGGAA